MSNRAPFLNVMSFVTEEEAADIVEPETSGLQSSPFLALYESEEGDGLIDPQTEQYVVFLNELYDEEFDEALSALVNEATAIYETHFLQESEGPQTIGYQAERLLNRHFAPLAAEAEAMIEALAKEFGHRNAAALTEGEIEAVIDQYQPSAELSPSFDDFLGKVKKAVKKAAKAVAKVHPIGIALQKLKPLVKPLLKRVIETAIGKLPSQLQPIARQLATRLPFLKELEEVDEHVPESAETCEVAQIQYEFNHRIANLLFAPTEVEQDLEIARLQAEQPGPDSYPLADLDHARERFVGKLRRLKEGEDPTPHVEEFIPAILPALKLGIKIVGRQRVVNFLAGLLGKVIGKFVGPQHTAALSRAIVDAGLRLIQLEATPEDEADAAASAVAATVEETVRRVTALPDYVLDDQELLEGFALEAFESAAAANLPPVLPEETYRKRPDLREAKIPGVWVPYGPRKRFKKFSRRLRSKLTPHKVAAIESFEGIPLEEFLEEELGVAPGEEIEAVAHLYESLPGTHLSDIARLDEDAPGLDLHAIHPLTREAAGLLLDEPDLGRDVDSRYLVDPHTIEAGQRFYYLEVPGHRLLTTPEPAGRPKVRRPTQLRLVLDFPRGEIRLYLFLSEIRAQEIAVKLRQHAHIGTVTAHLRPFVQRGLRSALTGAFGRTKIIHEAVTPDRWLAALRRLPSLLPQALRGRLEEWVLTGLSKHLKQRAEKFIKAADDTVDGVTLVVTVGSPPGFARLRQALKGKTLSLATLKMSGDPGTISVEAKPGYVYE
jgi:hypothetical protein